MSSNRTQTDRTANNSIKTQQSQIGTPSSQWSASRKSANKSWDDEQQETVSGLPLGTNNDLLAFVGYGASRCNNYDDPRSAMYSADAIAHEQASTSNTYTCVAQEHFEDEGYEGDEEMVDTNEAPSQSKKVYQDTSHVQEKSVALEGSATTTDRNDDCESAEKKMGANSSAGRRIH